MEKLDGCISHCWWWARFSRGWENRAKLWVGLLTSMSFPFGPPPPPNLCWGHFPAWAGGGSIFWSAELSLWGLELHTDLKKRGLCLLPQPCLGFSLGFGVRLWALNWYFASLDLVLSFCLVSLYLLTNDSFFLVFFFPPMLLKALGTKDLVMTLVSPQVANMGPFLDVFWERAG